MPISDLTGTMWILDKNIPSQGFSDTTFVFNYRSNNTDFFQLDVLDQMSPFFTMMYIIDRNASGGAVQVIERGTGWIDEAYRIISITGGRDVKNSLLINLLEENATQVPVVDLTGTSWVFDGPITYPQASTATYYLQGNYAFTEGASRSFSTFKISNQYRQQIEDYVLEVKLDELSIYVLGWQGPTPLIIDFSSGTDVSNPDLISWLSQNATLQTTSQISVDLTALSGWSDVSSGNHTLTIKAKATGYRDSALSTGVSFTKAGSNPVMNLTGLQSFTRGDTCTLKIYDGADETGTLLFNYTFYDDTTFSNYLQEHPTITFESGNWCMTFESGQAQINSLSTTGGITIRVWDDSIDDKVYASGAISSDGTITAMLDGDV